MTHVTDKAIAEMHAKMMVNALAQGRKEFTLSYEYYKTLSVEVQKELDRNFWRFGGPNGYEFDEMDAEAKAHFANQEMVIHHSIFER